MSTQSIINEFKAYRKDNATAIQLLIKSDAVAKQYYEGIAEATEDFTDYDAEVLEASDFIEVMNRFNSKMKPFLSRSKGEPPTVGVYTMTKNEPKLKSKAKPLTKPKNAKLVTAKNTTKPTKKGMKPIVEAEPSKPKTKTKSKRLNKPKNAKLVTAKNTAKPSKTGMKRVVKVREKAAEKSTAKPMPKVTVKPKSKPATKAKATTVKPEPKAQTVTHIETAEHRLIKRFLAIRKKETLQLAMTAYKSLQKDITERKIRVTSPQADIIKAIQKSYYKYLMRTTASIIVDEATLKAATDFVGSQKPSETVEMVKRFIRFTGVSPTEKQLKDYLKDAEKVMKAVKESDPYADELKSIIKTVKAAKVGDIIIADSVGLSGLNSNTIKVRK